MTTGQVVAQIRIFGVKSRNWFYLKRSRTNICTLTKSWEGKLLNFKKKLSCTTLRKHKSCGWNGIQLSIYCLLSTILSEDTLDSSIAPMGCGSHWYAIKNTTSCTHVDVGRRLLLMSRCVWHSSTCFQSEKGQNDLIARKAPMAFLFPLNPTFSLWFHLEVDEPSTPLRQQCTDVTLESRAHVSSIWTRRRRSRICFFFAIGWCGGRASLWLTKVSLGVFWPTDLPWLK